MTKLINFPKLIKIIWICMWVILLILVIIKLAFNKWYPIVINNENLLGVFTWIDNHAVVRVSINCLFYCTNSYFIYLTATKRKYIHWIELIILLTLSIGNNVLKNWNNGLGVIGETIIGMIIPIIYNIKFKTFSNNLMNFVFPILINIVLALWQLNILFIRDINELLKNIPTFISYTLQLDYYVFLIITWIGVVYIMSTLGFWFFGKSLNELKRIREEELAKENPDEKLLEEVEAAIKKAEEKLEEKEA